ncbi:twin-arginine translocation signal domain-containing protein, partial [Streptomyces sp. NPDC059627]
MPLNRRKFLEKSAATGVGVAIAGAPGGRGPAPVAAGPAARRPAQRPRERT